MNLMNLRNLRNLKIKFQAWEAKKSSNRKKLWDAKPHPTESYKKGSGNKLHNEANPDPFFILELFI